MKSTISYRKATQQDAALLATLRVRFLKEVSNNSSMSNAIGKKNLADAITEEASEEQEASNLRAELTTHFTQTLQSNKLIAWLAESKQEIVATSTMAIWKPPIGFSGIGKTGWGYILNMYTLPSYRKQGISNELLSKLVQTAKELKLEKLHLHATKEGMHLYKKQGFTPPTYPELVLNI